jgi:transcriptional regulator with XRE-family HTH domain
MAARDPVLDRARRRAPVLRTQIGEELRSKRLGAGLTQALVAEAARMSRSTYSRIEGGARPATSIDELALVAAVLGLTLSVRRYPGGEPLRDAAQLNRLALVLRKLARPLRTRTEVPLPRTTEHPELRAWDAVIFGSNMRTAVEVEMRLHDAQALQRRLALKRRDDPVERFLLVIADTKHNRRALADFDGLFADLRRLRPSAVRSALRRGEHPPTGLVVW